MRALETLIADNIALLRQGQEVLAGLDRTVFTRTHPELALSGVGSHVRHTWDFYSRLLAGLATSRVDYDARERDPRLETDPQFANTFANGLIRALDNLRDSSSAEVLLVKSDSEGAGPEFAPWTRSSLERELQATLSHTVHHYAIIAILLRLAEIDPGPEFGVAPSTLRYWEEGRACAR